MARELELNGRPYSEWSDADLRETFLDLLRKGLLFLRENKFLML